MANNIKIKLNSPDHLLLDRFVKLISNAITTNGVNSINAYPIPTINATHTNNLDMHRRIIDIHTTKLFHIQQLNEIYVPKGIDLYVISN
jgi:ribosomal protein S10